MLFLSPIQQHQALKGIQRSDATIVVFPLDSISLKKIRCQFDFGLDFFAPIFAFKQIASNPNDGTHWKILHATRKNTTTES